MYGLFGISSWLKVAYEILENNFFAMFRFVNFIKRHVVVRGFQSHNLNMIGSANIPTVHRLLAIVTRRFLPPLNIWHVRLNTMQVIRVISLKLAPQTLIFSRLLWGRILTGLGIEPTHKTHSPLLPTQNRQEKIHIQSTNLSS